MYLNGEKRHFDTTSLIFYLFLREVVLADSAERADPILGEIFKCGPCSYAVVRVADLGIIDISTYVTYIFSHGGFRPFYIGFALIVARSLEDGKKTGESFSPLLRARVDPGALEDLDKNFAGFLQQDIIYVLCVELRVKDRKSVV